MLAKRHNSSRGKRVAVVLNSNSDFRSTSPSVKTTKRLVVSTVGQSANSTVPTICSNVYMKTLGKRAKHAGKVSCSGQPRSNVANVARIINISDSDIFSSFFFLQDTHALLLSFFFQFFLARNSLNFLVRR